MNEQRLEIVFTNALRIEQAPPPPLGYALLTIQADNFTITAKGESIMYTLPVDHTVTMQVSYVDSAGNAAEVDGEVEWFPANPEIAGIKVDPDDDTICKVIPVKPGRTQVSCKADADLGDGTRELLTVCDIMIVAGEAVAGSIQPVGEPEPKF
jgi:hypothetical protein